MKDIIEAQLEIPSYFEDLNTQAEDAHQMVVRMSNDVKSPPYLSADLYQDRYPNRNLAEYYGRHGSVNRILLWGDDKYFKRQGFDHHPTISVTAGLPASGKTRFARLQKAHKEYFVRKAKAAQKQAATLRHVTYNWESLERRVYNRWEKRGEDSFDPLMPWPSEALEEVEVEAQRVAASLLAAGATHLDIEIPAITSAINSNGYWIGRPLGGRALYNIAKRQGEFVDFLYEACKRNNKSPEYYLENTRVRVAVLIAGDSLALLGGAFRSEMKFAANLEEASQIARLYGRTPPQTHEEWKALRDGATLIQMANIHKGLVGREGVITNVLAEHSRLVDAISSLGESRLQEQLRPNNNLHLLNLVDREILARVIRRQIEMVAVADHYLISLGLTPEDQFIGINNPLLTRMGIKKPEQLERLRRHYLETGIMDLLRE